MKPGARGGSHAAKRSSYSTFITIICFSVGLLGGYLILGSPRTADHMDVGKADDVMGGRGTYGGVKKVWSTRRELLSPKANGGGVAGSAGDLPRNGALGMKPPTKGEVSKEMTAALKEQSDKSDHAAATKDDGAKQMTAALKQQQSDKSETAPKTTDGKDKEALMKAQQSDKSERKAASGEGTTRQEQTKSAVAGGTNAATDATAASATKDAAASTTAAATNTTTAAPNTTTAAATNAAASTTTAAATSGAAATNTTVATTTTAAATNAAAASATTAAATTGAAATNAAAASNGTAATTTTAAATNTAAAVNGAAATTTTAAATNTVAAANTPAATNTAAVTDTVAASTTTDATSTTTAAATNAAAATTSAAASDTVAGTTATAAAATTTATPVAVSPPSPPPPTFKGVFPDANTWPITPVKERMPVNTIHTLFTSNGSPYQNIQARIMVGTYNIVRRMPGGERMVALTRILHRTTPDEVMDEIPTFLAQPLQPECDKWCWFPVADRANAMQQFIDAAEKDPSLIKAPWLLLLETDYVWMKPLPDPGDAYDRAVPGWSFGFDYIAPSIPLIQQLLKERCPDCDPKTVPNSGPAPVLARFSDFKAATPIWEELSKWIETHEDAKKMLGWVREMYAWDIGVAANKLNIKNVGPPGSALISQPPHDQRIGNASMYHYTWGTIYKKPGVEKEFWIFDKRSYTAYEHQLKLPAIPMPPAWTDDIVLQDGLHVSKELHDTVVDMLARMNEAIKQLPDLTEKVKKAQEAAATAAATVAATVATKVTTATTTATT